MCQLFFYFFVISCFLFVFYLSGFITRETALKIPAAFFLFFILFLEIYLFAEFKIKGSQNDTSLGNNLERENENMAEFLTLTSCKIVEGALKISRQKKLSQVSGQALLYSALLEKNIQSIVFRLGIDVQEMLVDVKNYLEKSRSQSPDRVEDSRQRRSGQGSPDKIEDPRQSQDSMQSGQLGNIPEIIFSLSFQEIILEAAKVAFTRGLDTITDKDLLIALGRKDDFLKEILVGYGLQEKDLEDLTLWLDSVEKKIQKRKQLWRRENLAGYGFLGRDFASGFTVTLDQFSVDWQAVVSKYVFHEVIGHQEEIEELERVLAKDHLGNALIVGESGVGRKSVVEALAQRCFLGTSLLELNSKRVVELDMISLISRIKDQEILESTLEQIFEEAIGAGNVILVIDKLEQFIFPKKPLQGAVDISGILAKYLLIPNFRFIAITSLDALHQQLEHNPYFLEYFRKISVKEISESETLKVLQNLLLTLEQKHKIFIIHPSIRETVHLTAKYMPSLPFPKKAIDVLEEAAVLASKEKVLLPHHIAEVVSEKTEIPVGKIQAREKEVLLNLENLIHQKIINQEQAVQELAIALRRARAGITSTKRPMGVFLFIGPTGVGKTETAKALSEIYFNQFGEAEENNNVEDRPVFAAATAGKQNMIRVDMSEFQSISDIARLIGAVSPVEQEGILTTPVREKPFSLVLLDEIEKAHPNILNLFLQVFDEGHVTDGRGRKVVFSNTIIICTSNAGSAMIFKAMESGQQLQKEKILDAVFQQKVFTPEFINRFDAVVLFRPLTKENLIDIAQLMLDKLVISMKEKGIVLIVTGFLKDKIIELSYKPEFGAREMRRVIQNNIEHALAQALLAGEIKRGDTIEINPENFKIIKIP